ncbi:MAG TPA: DUF5667 domain-containing protein, partial [Chloroflexota bacterium]|nr:DUF5667 domain-containing protein [Chloroflexota bacterium]
MNEPRAEQQLAEALEACLRALEAGEPLPAVLERYPEQRAALEALLPVARAVRAVPPPPGPSDETRQVIRGRLMARLDSGAPPAEAADPQPDAPVAPTGSCPPRRRYQRPGWALVALRGAAAIGLVIVLVLASVTASAAALPGDLFYPVKRAAEQAQLSLASEGEPRAELRLELADRRLEEVAQLLERGDASRAAETAARAQQQVEAAVADIAATQASPAEVHRLARQFESRLGHRRQQIERVLPSVDAPSREALERAVDQPLRVLEPLLPTPTPLPPLTPPTLVPSPTPIRATPRPAAEAGATAPEALTPVESPGELSGQAPLSEGRGTDVLTQAGGRAAGAESALPPGATAGAEQAAGSAALEGEATAQPSGPPPQPPAAPELPPRAAAPRQVAPTAAPSPVPQPAPTGLDPARDPLRRSNRARGAASGAPPTIPIDLTSSGSAGGGSTPAPGGTAAPLATVGAVGGRAADQTDVRPPTSPPARATPAAAPADAAARATPSSPGGTSSTPVPPPTQAAGSGQGAATP